MRKNLLILFIFTIALIFTECGKGEFTESYEKMQTSKGLDSYQLDLRIYETEITIIL